jgi:hypothetical protein
MPSYDQALMNTRIDGLRIKLGPIYDACPADKSIAEFIQSVAQNENPWFVDLGLQWLLEISVEEARTESQLALCGRMLTHILESFLARKQILVNSRHFNYGQLMYVLNFEWNRSLKVKPRSNRLVDVLRAKKSAETHINKHLGHLFAYPNSTRGPYFSLVALENDRFFIKGMVKFLPTSVFNSFLDAPFTGLVLFGLNSSHQALVDYGCERISVCRMLLELTPEPNIFQGFKNSGHPLEMVTKPVAERITEFVNFLNNASGKNTKILRTDKGLEFVNKEILSLCAEKGITHETAAPGDPSGNGLAQ